MGIDVRIDTEDYEFKFRACGIIYQDGKFLVSRIKDNSFYCLPGGHVELGEDTKNATIREMKEETGYDLKIEKLIAVTENFYNTPRNAKGHEIAFYYLMSPLTPIKIENRVITEIDKGEAKRLEFYWWNPETEPNINFKPPFIKDKLLNKDFETEVVIIKD